MSQLYDYMNQMLLEHRNELIWMLPEGGMYECSNYNWIIIIRGSARASHVFRGQSKNFQNLQGWRSIKVSPNDSFFLSVDLCNSSYFANNHKHVQLALRGEGTRPFSTR